ncbi:CLUMA_CG020941, isoform A [Clunio marinus]|uniref:CLUMA_CG020941, isoform A n=1 Tax=Clunio marinus TaxID=568069 RepID=A0A1J1J6Y1_9DIPT|nr:CLUMA_CG020941, isoform A [Clunio marinus]
MFISSYLCFKVTTDLQFLVSKYKKLQFVHHNQCFTIHKLFIFHIHI